MSLTLQDIQQQVVAVTPEGTCPTSAVVVTSELLEVLKPINIALVLLPDMGQEEGPEREAVETVAAILILAAARLGEVCHFDLSDAWQRSYGRAVADHEARRKQGLDDELGTL